MFVGHYGPSFVGKRLHPEIPLWLLFVAVQWMDVLWSLFVLLGWEKVRIVPGLMPASALDLYYMPYTHSLPGALVCSAALGLLYALTLRKSGAVMVAAASFSHWLLDLAVHRPDLALWGDAHKVGFALWNHPRLEFSLEAAILLGGLVALGLGFGFDARRWRAFGAFAAVLVLVQLADKLGPPPASDRAAAVGALVAYAVIALVAFGLERRFLWVGR
jgi:hypothetical protein